MQPAALQRPWLHAEALLVRLCMAMPLLASLQATFSNPGLHQQHLDSAAHKKALARQERERAQAEQLSHGREAAENAVVSPPDDLVDHRGLIFE